MSDFTGDPRNLSDWLPGMIGPINLQANGGDFPVRRDTLNFEGSVSIVDNPDFERTDIFVSTTDGAVVIDNAGTGALVDVVTTSGGATARELRFTGAAPSLTGLASGALRTSLLALMAVGGPLIIQNQNVGSSAANRIVTGSGSDITIAQGGGAIVGYDATSAVWRVLATSIVGGGVTPAGTTGQIQAKSSSGGLEALPWTYDGSANVTSDAAIAFRIKNAAGSGQWNAIIREGSGTGETLTINGDLAGDAAASAPNGELLGTRSAYLGINDASAFIEPVSAAAGGVACVGLGPGLYVGSAASSAIGGGATGFLTLKTTTEPTSAPSASQGTMLWTDKQATPTGQLLAAATVGGSADVFPLSQLYVAAVFASDASRNLTTAESRATALAVSGTITATRTLTNTAMRPTANHVVIVQNNCAQSVTYAWSSGTGITVAAGKGAIISGDGTNAVLVATFQLAGGSGVTWANDLSSSTNTAQYVSSLSGANGSGGVVNITGSTSLQWDVAATTPILNQATKASGTGAAMTHQAQSTSSGVGGSMTVASGAGTSGAGNLNFQLGATLAMQFTPGSLVAGDIMSTGTGTVMQRTGKGSNFTFWGVNGSGVVGYNPVSTSYITPGTSGQFMTTTAGPGVNWGNTASFYSDNGTTPATIGVVRASNATNGFVFHDASAGNVVALSNTGSDVYLGSDIASGNAAANLRANPSSAGIFGIAGTAYFLWQSSTVVFRQAALFSGTVGGESGTSTAFHWAAASIAVSGGGTVTATAAQYACPYLTLTGASTGILVLPNTTGAAFWIKNNNVTNITVKTSGGTGVSLSTGARAMLVCNGTDYEQY